MRIAYFTDTREIGGAERNLADMALAAVDAGHVVTLLAPQEAVVAYLRERVPGASVIQVGSDRYHDAIGPVRRAAALSRQLAVLRAELRRLRPDLLHVNNGGFPGSDLCRIAPLTARLTGVPARVMSVHSVPWGRDYLSHRAVQSVADSVVWRNVDAVVCPSRAVMDGLIDRRKMPAELGRLLYYGVAEPAAEAGDRATLRRRLAPGDELLVGMVSNRPVAEKGYDVFIEALARAPEIRGVLVGPHPGPEFVARVEQLGIEERLALEGPQKAVAPYYKAIDVLAVPSTAYECMPLVILEAMAAGKPVIGSQLSGIPEAIIDGQTGRTFPPGDVEALSAILRDGAASSRVVWQRRGEAGRHRWEDCFTLPRMGVALTGLYASLVPDPNAPDSGRSSGGANASRSLWLLDHAPIMGGAERFALRLARHAVLEDGYTARVVCPLNSVLAQRCRGAGIETIGGDFPGLAPWLLARQLPALAHTRRRLVEAGPHGIVVANTSRTQAYAATAAMTLRHPPAIVHIAHEQDTARRFTARFALARQGALIAVGANAAAAYRLAIPAAEVGQVNNFLTPEEMTRLRDEVRPAHTGVAIGLIARMIPEKGILELLAELAAGKAEWATLLVAASSEDPAYEAQVQARVGALGLGQRVVLMGHLDDVSELLYAVDVVVVPSTGSEGQPTVILEALAAGLAVVLRRSLYSRDYEGLPVFAYTDASDLPVALDRAVGSSPASMTELRERFGPAQALAALEHAALRATSGPQAGRRR